MLRTSAFAVLLLLSTSAMAADDDAKKALKSLEGEWKVVKLVAGGQAVDEEKVKTMTFTIKGDQLVPSDNPKDSATISVDPTQKPAAIDVKDTHNDTALGIYSLDGDTLKICLGTTKDERPKEFKSDKDTKAILIELKKAKK
jgi:uncharacterized protein (TIGR03067 family)